MGEGNATACSADRKRPKAGGRSGDASRYLHVDYLALHELKPNPSNPRKHSLEQIRALARSMKSFDFNVPILADKNKKIIAGHCRYEAAGLAGYSHVPVICLEHLNEAQARAFMLADNKFTDRSSWDDTKLALHLKELSELVLDFEIEDAGFESPEIDFRI